MFLPIKRFGTTVRWSDAIVYHGVAYIVEVPSTLPADARAQSAEVLSQLEATLLKAGSAKDQLLMCTIYLADLGDRNVFQRSLGRVAGAGNRSRSSLRPSRTGQPRLQG